MLGKQPAAQRRASQRVTALPPRPCGQDEPELGAVVDYFTSDTHNMPGYDQGGGGSGVGVRGGGLEGDSGG